MKRTLTLETPDKVDQQVKLFGWINSVREHGNVVFADLRDRSGMVQLVGDQQLSQVSRESVVEIKGKVTKRDKKYFNDKIKTGQVEVQVEELKVLSKAKTPPFEITDDGLDVAEKKRLKYRYLYLRRRRLQNNLRLRSKIANGYRQALINHDFTEIETPLLTKSTPEGARDFLVPSRMQTGKFYALPQSPQQYKQLLMVAGFERYFQLARCLRDEDLRANRSNEFTQVDIEMSFMTRDEILDLIEKVTINVFENLGLKIKQTPFPKLSYKQAMEKYGDDKFDLRTEKEKQNNVLSFAWVIDFPLFEQTETRDLNPMHHPFTAPNPEDIDLLDSQPEKVRSWQYDLVCNGMEVGGGSVRITDPKVQSKVFEILGHNKQEIQEKFGHLLQAFDYGVPPHGGIALGLFRLVMAATGENSLREVVAFPPTSSGKTAVMDAPSKVEQEQLQELGIKLIESEDDSSQSQ
jgi:aspartyl-tRNA synthetase